MVRQGKVIAMAKKQEHPRQKIDYPGKTGEMNDQPHDEMRGYRGSGLLEGKKALITGGDSGIGRAVAVAFAKEGADVAIAYLNEDEDARHTRRLVKAEGRECHIWRADLSSPAACRRVVSQTAKALGDLDILVNNVAYQQPVKHFTDITTKQWRYTFAVNIESYFHTTRAAVKHLRRNGGCVINTSSINGLRGNKSLIDYSATKGAVLALTYSLAQALRDDGIRVNSVAPGPVWTPLIPSTMPADQVESFGKQAPFDRAAQPDEIAPSFVFFASGTMSSYYSGEVLAPIGGETLPG